MGLERNFVGGRGHMAGSAVAQRREKSCDQARDGIDKASQGRDGDDRRIVDGRVGQRPCNKDMVVRRWHSQGEEQGMGRQVEGGRNSIMGHVGPYENIMIVIQPEKTTCV